MESVGDVLCVKPSCFNYQDLVQKIMKDLMLRLWVSARIPYPEELNCSISKFNQYITESATSSSVGIHGVLPKRLLQADLGYESRLAWMFL